MNQKVSYNFFFLTTLCLAMSSFRIASLNLNGARDVKKRTMCYDLLKTKCIDIAFVQETHSNNENEVEWKREWDGNIVLSHKSTVSAGVAILFSKSFLPISFDLQEIVKGRLIKVVAKYEKSTLVLLNVYAPVNPGERHIFLEELENTLSNCASTDI